MFTWFTRGGFPLGGGPGRAASSRVRGIEAELQRLDGAIGREEAQFLRLVSRPPAQLAKYDVIRWREERRRERDTRLAGLRDRQDQLRTELADARRADTTPNPAELAD